MRAWVAQRDRALAACGSGPLRVTTAADAVRVHPGAARLARRGARVLRGPRHRRAARRAASGRQRGRRAAREGVPSHAVRPGLVGRRLAEGVRRHGEGRRRAVHLHRRDADGRRARDEPLDHLGGADHPARGHGRAEGHLAAAHPARRHRLRGRLLGAERRHRPRGAAHARRAGRRRVGDQRPEDLEHRRAHGDAQLGRGPHRARGARSIRASR